MYKPIPVKYVPVNNQNIVVYKDCDDEEILYVGFEGGFEYGWFAEEDLEPLFEDLPRLALAIRFCNFVEDYDPYNGVSGDEAVPSVYECLATDTDILIEELQRDIEYLEEDNTDPDLVTEGKTLIRIISSRD